jgi:GT2 family glycosyltransferase
MWASVARELGWDESFEFGSSDIEMGWRAALAGRSIVTAPGAIMQKRPPADLRGVARKWFRYGMSDGKLYRTFRDRGMPRSRVGHAVRAWGWIVVHLFDLFRDGAARAGWIRVISKRAGRVAGSVRYRVLFL